MHSAIILAGVLGIDLTQRENAVFIEDATNGIVNMDAFIGYCRDTKVNYKAFGKAERLERLDLLATEYKKLQLDAMLSEKYAAGEKYAKDLAEKVKSVRDFVSENGCRFGQLLDPDTKERLFADHELRALKASAGSTLNALELSYVDRLAGEIYKVYVENVKEKNGLKKPYEKLTKNIQEEVGKLLSK